MEDLPYNKLPHADLHGGAGTNGPMDRETRYKNAKPVQNSDKEE